MAKTYKLTIKLNDFDLVKANKVLSIIGNAIENGFSDSKGFPALWELTEEKQEENPNYENFQFIDENGKALDDNHNEYRDENGSCVYVSKPFRKHFDMVEL